MMQRKQRKYIKLLLKLWIAILFVCGGYLIFNFLLSYGIYNSVINSPYFKLKQNKFELNSEFDLNTFIDTNYKIIELPYIKKDVLGKRMYDIVLEHDNELMKIPVEIEIIDTIEPVINLKVDEIEIIENQSFNVYDYFTVLDSDSNIKVTISPFDLTIGKKLIEIKAIDSSNNTATKILTLNVLRNIVDLNKKEQKAVEEKPEKIQTIQKYFLFKDGYTMQSAYSECEKELQKVKNGLCKPEKDKNNIFVGYILQIK